MARRKVSENCTEDFAWLGEVQDVHFPLSASAPIIVRPKLVTGGDPLPRPTIPHPEQHPFYELGIVLEGDLLMFIGAEKVRRSTGSMMLMGPGIPHNAFHLDYPHRSIAVHFLPILLLEMGPLGDGARMLSRFSSARTVKERVFDVPRKFQSGVIALFHEMVKEYSRRQSCWEFRLRSLLLEMLTQVFRWEEAAGRKAKSSGDEPNWVQLEKILRFIHENYARPIYVKEIARAAGLTVNGLQDLFRKMYGAGCVHYLQSFRIAQAQALLCQPGMRVTEAAMASGFGTVNHFNTAFRNLTGMSPTEFVERNVKQSRASQK